VTCHRSCIPPGDFVPSGEATESGVSGGTDSGLTASVSRVRTARLPSRGDPNGAVRVGSSPAFGLPINLRIVTDLGRVLMFGSLFDGNDVDDAE
jgi:hypothetical protein